MHLTKSPFLNYIRGFDKFGEQISLTYNGSNTFNTICGSLATIILKVIMFFYAIIYLQKVYNNDIYSLNIDERWFDLDNDP